MKQDLETEIRGMDPSWWPLILAKVAEIAPEIYRQAASEAVSDNAKEQIRKYGIAPGARALLDDDILTMLEGDS